jgi:hypothetical protein
MRVATPSSESVGASSFQIGLEIAGQRFDVAEIGPAFVRVRDAVPVAPGPAIVRCDLGGRLTTFEVQLADGIDPRRPRQPCRVQIAATRGAVRVATAAR